MTLLAGNNSSEPQRRLHYWSRSPYIALLIVSLAVLFLLICLSPTRAGIDTAIITEVANKLVSGQRPYIDFFEFDLPTIYYFHVVPVYVSRILAINALTAFNLEVYGLIIFTCAAIIYVMRRILGTQDTTALYTLPILVALHAIVAFGEHFFRYGQREHLILLAYLPWFLLRWYRWNQLNSSHMDMANDLIQKISPIIAFGIGLAACIGASIKPFFIPIFLIADLFWLVVKRRWRPLLQPEIVGTLAFACAYGLYFFVINPAPMQHYIADLMPVIVSNYSVWSTASASQLLGEPLVLVSFVFAALPWLIPTRSPSKLWSMVRPLSLVIVAALLVYIVQQKGWLYQRMPADGLLFFLAVLIADHMLKQRRAISKARFFQRLVVIFVLMIGLVVIVVSTSAVLSWREAQADPVFKELLETYTESGDSILFLDTCCGAYPTTQQFNRWYASRYVLGAYPISFGYYNQDLSDIYTPEHRVPPIVQDYLDSIPADIDQAHPTMIYIRKGECRFCPPGLDLFAYFEARGVISEITERGYSVAEDRLYYRVYVPQQATASG